MARTPASGGGVFYRQKSLAGIKCGGMRDKSPTSIRIVHRSWATGWTGELRGTDRSVPLFGLMPARK